MCSGTVYFGFLLNLFLINKVMPIQTGKNGVNGPAQKAKQMVAIVKHHCQPKMLCNRYPPQTGK